MHRQTGYVTYEYGKNGTRRERTTSTGAYTWYNYAGFSLQSEEDALGALERTHVGTVADFSGSDPATATARYFTHDMLGSVRGGWDSGKSPLGTVEFTPYGSVYTGSISDARAGFGGELKEDAHGLNLYLFRAYDPATARWLSREPLGLDGPNLYAFVLGNPTTHVDIGGLYSSLNNRSAAGFLADSNNPFGLGLLMGGAGATFGGNSVLPPSEPAPGGGNDTGDDGSAGGEACSASGGPAASGGGEGGDVPPSPPAAAAAPEPPRSPGYVNNLIGRGQAPRSMTRADHGRVPGELPHIHFKGGHALNNNGTWKHGGRLLTNKEKDFLRTINWQPPG